MQIPLTLKQKVKIANSKDVFLIMREILRRENKLAKEQEHFWIVGLNNKHRILYIELMGLGSATSVPTPVKKILKMAIYKDADAIIAIHNHPSSNLTPSKADKDVTQYLMHGCNFVEIKLIDHIIISDKKYFSFKENFLI
jgi:DNA repair protein RadC